MIDFNIAEALPTMETVQARYFALAAKLMNEFDLIVECRPEMPLRISVLEMYIYDARSWRDPTTHRCPLQKSSGRWYLHGHGGTAPTRMGLDITAGSENPEIFIGLLIRGLDGVDGSGRAVNFILRGRSPKCDWKYSESEKNFLKCEVDGHDIYSGKLTLKPASSPRTSAIYKGPRHGLPEKIEKKFRECPFRATTEISDKLAKTPVDLEQLLI